jgi:hypothetical protein
MRSLELIIEDVVVARSAKMGAVLTTSEWRSLSATICRDLAAGGAGLYLSQAAKALPPKDQWYFADLYLDGAIEGHCATAKKPPAPAGNYYRSFLARDISSLLRVELLSQDSKYEELLSQYIKDVQAYGRRYGVDVSPLLEAVPGSSGGSGYDVTCADGWVSSSGGKQGACSHHGGVR